MIPRLPRYLRRIFHRKGRTGKRFENSIAGLFHARRRGWRNVDLDVNATADDVFVCEHGKPTGPSPRRYTWAQLRALLNRRRARWPVRTVLVMCRWCRRLGLRPMLEVKADPRFEDPAYVRRLTEDVRRSRADARYMVLQDIGDAAARCRALKLADPDAYVILLARGRQPARWERDYAPYVDAVRGRWAS